MVATRNTREDVIAAAGRLFASQGYHGTSMRDLGRELGLRGSSLYSHVTSKEDLLVAVVERGAERFEASAHAALEAAESPTDRLRSLISGHIDIVLDHADEAKTFLDEAMSLDRDRRAKIVGARDRYEQVFRDVLAEGGRCGDFSEDVDPKLATIFILSILNAIERWFDPDGALDCDGLKAEAIAFVERSLS
jgi:AcrR family transcriptional regulator